MESMKDFEKEIEESFKNLKQYNDPDASKWEKFEEDRINKEVHRVKITEIVKGGAVTHLNEIRAFIPASQLSTKYVEDLESYQGKSLDVIVINVDEENKRLVLSHREIEEKAKKEEMAKNLSKISVGDVVEAKVESLKDYGAFLDLGNGLNGLLHISQISNKRIKHPGVLLKEGDIVRVQVIGIEDGKISLSKKILEAEVGEFEKDEEVFEYKENGRATTSLGDLLKGLKFD